MYVLYNTTYDHDKRVGWAVLAMENFAFVVQGSMKFAGSVWDW